MQRRKDPGDLANRYLVDNFYITFVTVTMSEVGTLYDTRAMTV